MKELPEDLGNLLKQFPDWVVTYENGEIYTSVNHSWGTIPGWGIQAIIFKNPEGKYSIRHQGDFYRLSLNREPVAMDMMSLLYYIVQQTGLIKVGTMVNSENWIEHHSRAIKIQTELNELINGSTVL